MCDMCAYVTIDNYHLERHQRLHTPTVIKCSKCNNISNSKFESNDHDKNCFYKCTYSNCLKKFKYDYKYDQHIRDHVNKLRRML